jgi:hypothetical protein
VTRDRIAIAPGSPFLDRLSVVPVREEEISAPRLTVTGSVVARLPTDASSAEGRWDFSDAQVATAYADWLHARTEEPFAERQLEKTRELAKARVAAQAKLVDRLQRLVGIGTDSEKDLAAARAELLQTQLETEKQVFEAESAWKTAERSRSTLERQLFQAGVPPETLLRSPPGTAIVVGEVPERELLEVRDGEPCLLRFLALPGKSLEGRVAIIGPSLTSDRRTLRVFFEIPDPEGQLRPGLFAEVDLDTAPRKALLVPADAILHLGPKDYVVAQSGPSEWRVAPVAVGASRGNEVEVVQGLAATDVVIGRGAVLLKPAVQDALSASEAAG